uniref:Uncharacterized protein n=1 Tax=Anguilla anguilla TaxID=7936 RepID=A0A0E9P6N8_ANGAN
MRKYHEIQVLVGTFVSYSSFDRKSKCLKYIAKTTFHFTFGGHCMLSFPV